MKTISPLAVDGSEIPRPITVWMVLKNPVKIMGFQLPTSPSPGELVYRMEPSTVYGSSYSGA